MGDASPDSNRGFPIVRKTVSSVRSIFRRDSVRLPCLLRRSQYIQPEKRGGKTYVEVSL